MSLRFSRTLRFALLPYLILFATFSFADSFDHKLASVILLQDKGVQRDLGITEAQRAIMNRYADEHRAKLQAYYSSLLKKHEKGDTHVLLRMFEEMKNGVLAQLTPSQLKRLREISLQAIGFSALADTTVATRVGLDSAQLKKVQSFVRNALERATKLRDRAVRQATADLQNQKPQNRKEEQALVDEANKRSETAVQQIEPQLDQIQEEASNQVLAQLTASQKQKWRELLGRPYKGG